MHFTQKHAPAAPKHTLELVLALLLAFLLVLLCAPRVHSQTPTATPTEAINALIAAPTSPLPAGTQLRSVRVADGLATVDFSRALSENFQGGDSQEVAAVNSILRALGRFPNISRVQILVAGRPIESLGGLLVISDPLPVQRPASDASSPSRRFHLHRKSTPSHSRPAARHRQALT